MNVLFMDPWEPIPADMPGWVRGSVSLNRRYYHAWDPPPRVEPRFVREEVDALVGLAREHDAAWGRWFSDRAIEPLELRCLRIEQLQPAASDRRVVVVPDDEERAVWRRELVRFGRHGHDRVEPLGEHRADLDEVRLDER